MPAGGQPYGNPHPNPDRDVQALDARLGAERPSQGLQGPAKPGFERLLKVAGGMQKGPESPDVGQQPDQQTGQQQRRQRRQARRERLRQRKERRRQQQISKNTMALMQGSMNSANMPGSIGFHGSLGIREGVVRFTDLPKQAQAYFTEVGKTGGVSQIHGWRLNDLGPKEQEMLKRLYLMGQQEQKNRRTAEQLQQIAGGTNGG